MALNKMMEHSFRYFIHTEPSQWEVHAYHWWYTHTEPFPREVHPY